MFPDGPLPDFSDVEGGSSSRAADPATAQEPRTYTVKRGDSLSKIAKAVYGDMNRWKALYEANKNVIGANPDLIQPGQVLTIPQL